MKVLQLPVWSGDRNMMVESKVGCWHYRLDMTVYVIGVEQRPDLLTS